MSESGYLEITAANPQTDPGEAAGSEAWGWHARLEWKGETLSVTDLGGQRPLLINGTSLEPNQSAILQDGDTIAFAGIRMVWRPGEDSPFTVEKPPEPSRSFLIITTPDWTRELPLQESSISLGRAEANDIVINNSGVSRFHARLERRPNGYEIIDQDSTFGLQFQGRPVSRKVLDNGDLIKIADQVSLTFKELRPQRVRMASEPGLVKEQNEDEPAHPERADEDQQELPFVGQTSFIDMDRYLATSEGPAPEGAGLWEIGSPHLVVHLIDRTWQAIFTKDYMSIGRDDDNDIVIPDSSVSSRHAAIERKADEFIIRDTGSNNGVWVGKQRVEDYKLRPGDIVNLGRAKLVFKGGFSQDDLTLIGTPTVDGRRHRRPVVFVPGLGGSELWLGSERVYPVPKILISSPELLSLPGNPRIEARKIVSDVVIIPGILKQEQYSRLGDYLESGLGYTRGKDLLEFAYDWRRDIRHAAKKLAQTIEQWRPNSPITIIGHSLGTLVTRYYVEKLGGKRLTERIVLMGGPQYGTPKALLVILVGPGLIPFGISNERIRSVMALYPTSYQILPIYPCVFDQDGRQIDVLKDESWLPEFQRPFLKTAREFRRELGYRSSVPCVSIFGYGYKTAVRTQIERRPDGGWQKVSFVEEVAGDLSVPAGSAVLKNSEIHPVFQEHGALYVDDDVKMRLKVELTRSTTLQGKRY